MNAPHASYPKSLAFVFGYEIGIFLGSIGARCGRELTFQDLGELQDVKFTFPFDPCGIHQR